MDMKNCFKPSVSTKNTEDPFRDLAHKVKEFGYTHYTKNLIDITFDIKNKLIESLLHSFSFDIGCRCNKANEQKNVLVISESQYKSLCSLSRTIDYISISLESVTNIESECYEYHLVFEKHNEDDRICTLKVDVEDGVFYEMLMGNFDKIPVRKEVSTDGPY